MEVIGDEEFDSQSLLQLDVLEETFSVQTRSEEGG